MVFGKKRSYEQISQDSGSEDDVHIYEYEDHPQSEDELEEVDFSNNQQTSSTKSKNNAKQAEKEGDLKPLLDEVIILQGSAGGKNPGGAKPWQCKHCKGNFTSTYTRIHAHFFGVSGGRKANIQRCVAVLKNRNELARIRKKVEEAEKEGVSHALKNSKLIQKAPKHIGPLEASFAMMDRHAVDIAVERALCANGIPFNVLRNPQFCQMVTAINRAPKGYKAPSFEKARTSLLDECKTSLDTDLATVKSTWYTDGVTIVSDGWSNIKKNPLINILAVNSRGAMFLYAEDCAGDEKSGLYICDLLLRAIEEVGPTNVIQIVTDNASNCKLAGKEVEKVHPHIFWSPCVVHTLNLIFKDLARNFDWFTETYLKGKQIVKYFVNHIHALTIFRNNSKLELLKVAKTRFASHYIMLKRLVDVREALATTVVLTSWKDLMKSGDANSKEIGAKVTESIVNDDFWDEVHNILAITKPIYKLIRFCDQDGPILSEVYECMDNMLGEIRDILRNSKYQGAYDKIEEIVLTRWEKMNVPVHCLGFALSPRFYHPSYVETRAPGGTTRRKPNDDREVMEGVLKAFEKIANDPNDEKVLRKEFAEFHMRRGLFAKPAAFADSSTMDAIDWWATYGSQTPLLSEVARKILSQPITSSSAERNWSTYSYIHSVKRNRLNSSRADKLVFIHSNIRLLSRFEDAYKEGPFKRWDIDPEHTIVDDSQLRLDELRWKSLDEDEAQIQENRVIEENSEEEQATQGPRTHSSNVVSSSTKKSKQSQLSYFMGATDGRSSSSTKDKGKRAK